MNVLRHRDNDIIQRVDLDRVATTLRGVILFQDSFGVACLQHFRTSEVSALARRREFAASLNMFDRPAARRIYDDYVAIGRLAGSVHCGSLHGRLEEIPGLWKADIDAAFR